MIKKKLDLNNLLSKYEGMGNHTISGYDSQVRDYDRHDEQYDKDYYKSRTYHDEQPVSTQTQQFTGIFQMSKSQCEQFLLRVREQLRNEERSLLNFSENSIKLVHERFHANHQKIRRQILELLDRAFAENERYITEQLKRHQSSEPAEFQVVHRKISEVDQSINKLLFGLKGHEYRKSIAETVMKDFTVEISDLKQLSKISKDTYLENMGEVQPDRQRIDCIKQDLHRLFKISKKNAQLVQQSMFSVLGGGGGGNPQNSNRLAANSMPQPQSKQRKSFFNFGFQS